jgi:hypothetical protein
VYVEERDANVIGIVLHHRAVVNQHFAENCEYKARHVHNWKGYIEDYINKNIEPACPTKLFWTSDEGMLNNVNSRWNTISFLVIIKPPTKRSLLRVLPWRQSLLRR